MSDDTCYNLRGQVVSGPYLKTPLTRIEWGVRLWEGNGQFERVMWFNDKCHDGKIVARGEYQAREHMAYLRAREAQLEKELGEPVDFRGELLRRTIPEPEVLDAE